MFEKEFIDFVTKSIAATSKSLLGHTHGDDIPQ